VGAEKSAPITIRSHFLYTTVCAPLERIYGRRETGFHSPIYQSDKGEDHALQAVLASVESASALGALAQPLDGASATISAGQVRGENLGVPIDLPEGAFNGKSVPACIETIPIF